MCEDDNQVTLVPSLLYGQIRVGLSVSYFIYLLFFKETFPLSFLGSGVIKQGLAG